jgi:large subunit ribosomal protein L35e
MVKAYELRGKTKEDLIGLLNEHRAELFTLRVAQIGGGAASKIAKIKSVRKNVARILTVHNQQQKLAVRKAFSGSKYLPKDLRKKATRAKRRALTKEQVASKTLKQQKKATHFPQRVYAVKA